MESNNISSSTESSTDDGYRVTQIFDLFSESSDSSDSNEKQNKEESFIMKNLYGDDTIYHIKHKICEYLKKNKGIEVFPAMIYLFATIPQRLSASKVFKKLRGDENTRVYKTDIDNFLVNIVSDKTPEDYYEGIIQDGKDGRKKKAKYDFDDFISLLNVNWES